MPLARKATNKAKRRSGIPQYCGTRGQSKLKAKPAPDFTKLHAKWQNQCDQRKAGLKPCTQIQEFHLSTPGLRKESSVPRPSSRPAVSLTRHHLHSQSHHREQRPGRTASSSSQSDDVDFVPENESLQSILSNTGISTATTFPPNQRQTLAVAPTFKTPFAVNEPRQSIYYTGPRNGDPVGLGESNTFSEYQRHLSSRLNLESAAASRASVSSPLLRGPIALPQRQSIYKKYVFPEPVGGASTDAARNIEVPSTLPRARRVPVTTTSSPALRTLSKSSAKKRVQWNDLDRHRTLTPDTKKDTVVTMLTFNDEASTSTSSSRVTRLAVEGVSDLKKDDEANVDQVLTGQSSANGDVIHQVEPVVESHSLKEPPTPRKVQFGLHPSSPSEGRRNRQVPKRYIPNVLVDVSNSPEGHFSPGITGILPSEYFGAIPKPPFFTGVDSSPKVYQARSIPETSTDKENLSPYISTFDPQSRPHGTVGNLEQDLSESVLEFDRLEGQVKKLRRKSDAIVANDGGAAKSSIMQQLAMIRHKQEELIRLQDALQCQLNKQVGKSEGRATEHCQEEGDVASSDPHQTSEGEVCNSRTEHITELMEDIQLRSSDAVREERSPPENRGGAPIVSHSPVVIVMESDAKSNAVTTPPTIQQRELLGIPLVTPGVGSSLLPFPQTPLRNSHYSPFVARFSGSDGSVLCTPSTPGSHLGMDYYDQAVFSPKSLMAGSAQILSPINESFPIQLPLAMFTPSPIKLGRNVAPVASRKLPVANLTRRLNDTLENFESMTPSPKAKRHSPLPRVVAPSVGTLSLAGNLAPHHRRNPRHQVALTSVRDKILGSAAHRYCEALLDEEVALFACRLHVTLGLAPLLITRCTDPVASVLEEGDDQHFVPICDSPLRSPPFSSAFSAFSNVTH